MNIYLKNGKTKRLTKKTKKKIISNAEKYLSEKQLNYLLCLSIKAPEELFYLLNLNVPEKSLKDEKGVIENSRLESVLDVDISNKFDYFQTEIVYDYE